jgi:enoyl-CoA hydratase
MSISYSFDGTVGHLRMDDGKANTIKPEFLDGFYDALESAERDEARALVIWGREGMFCAGFDLKALDLPDPDEVASILQRAGRFILDLWNAPFPTVAAVTGHAVAGGALIAMACDHRIGLSGSFKVGINETRLGLTMPSWGIAVAESAVPNERIGEVLLLGNMYDPAGAVDVGILHRVVAAPDALDAAVTEFTAQCAEIPTKAFGVVKRRLRRAATERALDLNAAEVGGDFLRAVAG